MSTGTPQYANLIDTSIQWNSLQEIYDSLQAAQPGVREGQRYFTIADQEIPVTKVVSEIYARRPSLLDADQRHLKLYFDTTKKFADILPPQSAERSTFRKIADCFSNCFWGCYCPIQLYWCTPGCRENVIVADSKLGLEGVDAWKEHIQDSRAM